MIYKYQRKNTHETNNKMAETIATPQPYITDINGILKVLRPMDREAFNSQVNVGLCLYNSCSGLLVDEQKPYAKELFENNETNKKMWIKILRNLELFETHKFEIKQYCLKDKTPQFHEDGSPMMLVFIKPKYSNRGDKTSK